MAPPGLPDGSAPAAHAGARGGQVTAAGSGAGRQRHARRSRWGGGRQLRGPVTAAAAAAPAAPSLTAAGAGRLSGRASCGERRCQRQGPAAARSVSCRIVSCRIVSCRVATEGRRRPALRALLGAARERRTPVPLRRRRRVALTAPSAPPPSPAIGRLVAAPALLSGDWRAGAVATPLRRFLRRERSQPLRVRLLVHQEAAAPPSSAPIGAGLPRPAPSPRCRRRQRSLSAQLPWRCAAAPGESRTLAFKIFIAEDICSFFIAAASSAVCLYRTGGLASPRVSNPA